MLVSLTLETLHQILYKCSFSYERSHWATFGLLDFYKLKSSAGYDLDDRFVNILVAAEDKRYWTHKGYDLIAIARSFFLSIRYMKLHGGSTITQQLVRVLSGNFEKTITRKAIEVILAHQLEKKYDKKFIAKEYLKRAYYGWKMNDLEQACERLGYDLGSLKNEQKIYLVALLKYPLPSNPSTERTAKINNRVAYIKARMKILGYA